MNEEKEKRQIPAVIRESILAKQEKDWQKAQERAAIEGLYQRAHGLLEEKGEFEQSKSGYTFVKVERSVQDPNLKLAMHFRISQGGLEGDDTKEKIFAKDFKINLSVKTATLEGEKLDANDYRNFSVDVGLDVRAKTVWASFDIQGGENLLPDVTYSNGEYEKSGHGLRGVDRRDWDSSKIKSLAGHIKIADSILREVFGV